MTIKRLIGSAPSQISRNKDLGNLAFQNKEAVRVDQLKVDGDINITGSYRINGNALGASNGSLSVLNRSGTTVTVSILSGNLSVLTRSGTTTNVPTY